MHLYSLAGWYLLFLPWLPAVVNACGGEVYPFVDELRKANIEPTRPGLVKFLESLRLTPERAASIRALLNDLGSPKFQIREKALARLVALPYIPHPLLEEAAARNLETSRRVDRIRKTSLSTQYESRAHLAAR